MKRKRSEDAEIELRRISAEMAESSIVTKALDKYLFQILEFVSDEYIEPQRKRIKELEHRLTVLGGKID